MAQPTAHLGSVVQPTAPGLQPVQHVPAQNNEIKSSIREDAIDTYGKHQIHEAAAGVTRLLFYSKHFF